MSMSRHGASLAVLAALWCHAHTPAVAETRPGYGGKVRGGLLSEPVHIDPAHARTHAELTLASLIFDTLYQVHGKEPSGALRVVPHLAADMPQVSADGRSARISIRPGVRFHGGARLEASDVAASLGRALESPSGYLLASVRAIDHQGDAVVLSLKRETPELAALLASPSLGITPAGRAPRIARAAGSGPFKLARFSRSERTVVLVANNRYFAGRPYINRLELRWFERGDDETEAYEVGNAELSLRGAVAYAGHRPKFETDEAMGPATILTYVGFGATRENRAITDHEGFRAALSLAMARDSFRAIGTGERIAATLHPVAAALGGPTPSRGQSGARMRDARARLDRVARDVPALRARADGQRGDFELELIIDRTRPDDRKVAEKVLAALFGLRIKARIASLEAAEFARRVESGECDLYIGQLAMPVAIPEWAMAAALARAQQGWIRSHLAANPLDLGAAERVFWQRRPIVPLFHRALRVHHRSNLRGIHFDDTSRLAFADLFFFGPARKLK